MYRQAAWTGGDAAIVLLATVGIAALLGRGIIRPLARLCSAMDRLWGSKNMKPAQGVNLARALIRSRTGASYNESGCGDPQPS